MKKKIWIVDDDEGILEAAQIILQAEGYEVKSFVNGRCFYDLTGDLPDLIILDVLLSGEDGRDICSQLKNQKETRHIPIIMTSAHSSAGRITNVYGADAFLAKPFDIDVLLDTIEKHLVKMGHKHALKSVIYDRI